MPPQGRVDPPLSALSTVPIFTSWQSINAICLRGTLVFHYENSNGEPSGLAPPSNRLFTLRLCASDVCGGRRELYVSGFGGRTLNREMPTRPAAVYLRSSSIPDNREL